MKLTNPDKAKLAVAKMVEGYSELVNVYQNFDMMQYPFPVDYEKLEDVLRRAKEDVHKNNNNGEENVHKSKNSN